MAAEDLQREMMQLASRVARKFGVPRFTRLGMRILSRQSVLEATGRVARPLNRFETEPLLYDLPAQFGTSATREAYRAYEAAWARLQHEEPGYAADPQDRRFESVLLDWFRFHRGMLIGEIVPQLYQYLATTPPRPSGASTIIFW